MISRLMQDDALSALMGALGSKYPQGVPPSFFVRHELHIFLSRVETHGMLALSSSAHRISQSNSRPRSNTHKLNTTAGRASIQQQGKHGPSLEFQQALICVTPAFRLFPELHAPCAVSNRLFAHRLPAFLCLAAHIAPDQRT
eukprot:1157661-Pelagomonas_calceolata.AAC.14